MGIQTGNYDSDACFKYNVYPGVEQIPISALGKTRYTNEEMENIARLSSEEKKSFIGNLYEAIQLFQISGSKELLTMPIISFPRADIAPRAMRQVCKADPAARLRKSTGKGINPQKTLCLQTKAAVPRIQTGCPSS